MKATLSEREFRRILAFTIGVPLLVMMICGTCLVLITNHMLYLMRQGRSNLNILTECRNCEKLVLEMETEARGFRTTGDATFLDPCAMARDALNHQLVLLSQGVTSGEDKNELDDFKRAVDRLEEMEAASIQHGKFDSSPDSLKEELDRKALLDGFRLKFDAFIEGKDKTMMQYRSEVDSTKGYMIVAEMVTLILIMVLTGFHVWRQMHSLSSYYERTLREVDNQKERFRVTLASIGDAVIVTDLNGKMAFMNAEAERLTGWSLPEAGGKALRDVFRIIKEGSRVAADDPVEKVFREKRTLGMTNHTILLSRNGAEWPIEDSASPVCDIKGNMVGVVLVFHDASEKRRAERLLKNYAEELEQKVLARTVELQRTNNELEAFSYTVSHDLRAPLRAMQGYSSALLEDYAESWGKDERELLNRIKNAAERLDVLIQDILTYSKISKEHQTIEPINLEQLVDDILTQYPTFQNPNATFEIKRPLEGVLGHPSGLTQVVSNILTNAVKFVASSQTAHVKVWTETQDLTVKLWVEDNGIGIDPANHDRIFKMFEQVNGKKFEGTGMGLAIAKKAVENMQGRIGVESSLGNGTRVWIELLKCRTR